MGLGDVRETPPRRTGRREPLCFSRRSLRFRGESELIHSFSGARPRFFVKSVLCAALCWSLVFSQSQETKRPVPTFRVGADLVVVDVTVRDRQGKPVQNLTQKDFVIIEEGQPQQIHLFAIEDILSEEVKPPSEMKVTLLTGAPKAAAVQASSGGASVSPQPDKKAPLSESAVSEPVDVRNKRWVILFFDLTSLPPPDLMRAEQSAVDFVDKQMTGGDLLSIVTFDTSLKVSQDFTQDRTLLGKQLERLVKGPESGLTQAAAEAGADKEVQTDETSDMEEANNAFVTDETEFNIFNSDRKLAAIETIAQWLAPYPEKKALIHYSGGVSRTGTENQAQLRATIAAAGKANLLIYPVDARGLVAMPSGGDAGRASTGSRSQFDGRAVAAQFSSHSDSQDTLWAMATDTGGRAFFDNNDLAPVFSQVHEDISHYYVLGYYSTNTRPDGRYRQIKVTVNVSGAKVTHRRGYYAPRDFSLLAKAERDQQLAESASLGALSSEFPLAVSAGYFLTRGDVHYVPVSVRFPSLNIPFLEKKGMHRAEFDFVGQVRGDKGRLVTFVKDTVRLNLDDPTYRALAQKSIQYDTGFYLKPGEYSLKFLVRENQTGKVSAFEQDLRIPAPQANALEMSSVFLGSQLQDLSMPPDAVRVLVDKDLREFFRNAASWQNPLAIENRKVVPSVTRVFHSSDQLYVVFEVYGAAGDPVDKNPDVLVSMTFWAGSRKVNQTPAYSIARFDDAERRMVQCRYQLPLDGLQRGSYMLQINAVDQIAGQHAHARIPLAIH